MAGDYKVHMADKDTGLAVGDHVKKKQGMKFIGRICAIYAVPHEKRKWCVVILDKNEASDHLQHLYPLDLFEKHEPNTDW